MDKIREMEIRDKLGKDIKFAEILKILEKGHQYHRYPECPSALNNILIVLFFI